MDLIERRPHPSDRRAILICLSKEGRRCARKINTMMVEANREFLGRFNRQENQVLRALLSQVWEDGRR